MDSYDSTEFVAGIYRLGLDWMSASADAASNSTNTTECCLEESNKIKETYNLFYIIIHIA